MAVKNTKANLIERNGWYHVVINYYEQGKRKQKSIALGMKVKGNKRKAEAKCKELLAEWEQRLALPVYFCLKKRWARKCNVL